MDTSVLLASFLAALSVRIPLLLVAVVGFVLSSLKVKPVSKSSHRVCVAGLLLLLAHVLTDAYGRAHNVELAMSAATRDELIGASMVWTFTTYALLVAATACLVAAVIVDRTGGK